MEKIAELRLYEWNYTDREDLLTSSDDHPPELLVPSLLAYADQVTAEVREFNMRILKHRFVSKNMQKLEALEDTKYETLDCLDLITNMVWDKLEKDGSAYQALAIFNKETDAEIDIRRLNLDMSTL